MKIFSRMMTTNRRAGNERRTEEAGPPAGWSDRRHSVERRLPEVGEASFAEWLTQFRGRQRSTDNP
jgi:hypothetical protein